MSEERKTPPGQLSAEQTNRVVGWLGGCAPVWLLLLVPIVYSMMK